jgi:hypothetical protein
MSLDTSLTHDGSLTTAFANYYNPVNTTLAGPGNTGQFLAGFRPITSRKSRLLKAVR